MNPFEYLKNLEHHAYFIQSFKDSFSHLKDYLKKKFKIDHSQNPDFYYEKFEVFGIDDSRKIKSLHSAKSFGKGNKRIFVIEADGITHEAQNSLLKIFEEPNEDTHFFVIMPSLHILLPTLRSRLFVLSSYKNDIQDYSQVKNFLKLSKKDKITFVDNLAEEISEEKATKYDAQKFLAELEIVLHEQGVEKNAKALKAVLLSRDYMNDRASSIKQLLEYVALSL